MRTNSVLSGVLSRCFCSYLILKRDHQGGVYSSDPTSVGCSEQAQFSIALVRFIARVAGDAGTCFARILFTEFSASSPTFETGNLSIELKAWCSRIFLNCGPPSFAKVRHLFFEKLFAQV